jgi:hypothetical protein
MGNVNKGLGKSLIPPDPDFIEAKGQDNGNRKTEGYAQEREAQSIGIKHAKSRGTEESLKMGESHPGTFEIAQEYIEILESHNQAKHRTITKDKIVEDSGDHHEVKPSLFPQSLLHNSHLLLLIAPHHISFPCPAKSPVYLN